MSYVNQDVEGHEMPFAGNEVVAKTYSAWLEKIPMQPTCWCGETVGQCCDCNEASHMKERTKINIGSGEDGWCYR